MNTFQQAFDDLNPEQQQAVTQVEGPLLVLAGPGTGKTQLLSMRAAYILKNTDARAENILCLTFTEKAALNMRQRMVMIIGPEAAAITVNTFHGLGAEIIRSNPDSFWNGAQLEPAPDAVKLDVIDTILSGLPLNNPLGMKFAGQNTLVKEVNKSIALAKGAGLTPSKLAALCEANLAWMEFAQPMLQEFLALKTNAKQVLEIAWSTLEALPEQSMADIAPFTPYRDVLVQSLTVTLEECAAVGKNTALSSWKSNWFTGPAGAKQFKDYKRSLWWRELADVYELYQAEMSQRGYFDFADMIIETIGQLEQNEDLRLTLQERYSHIMVDEFQDTNDAQFRLVYLLSNNPASEGRPNIMAVGDDDQAIYRFQGAQITNFQNFLQSYREVASISLTHNYRSEQPIIDKAADIAENIAHRLVHTTSLSKQLVAHEPQVTGLIEHTVYSTQAEQFSGVVDRLKTMRTTKDDSIVVLARNHGSLLQLASRLQDRGVPVDYELTSNVLEQPQVLLVLEVLRILAAIQSGDRELVSSHLATVLSHRALDVPAPVLWELATSKAAQASWLDALLMHERTDLQHLAQWLLELAKQARVEPARVILEQIMGLSSDETTHPHPFKTLLKTPTTFEQLEALSALQTLRGLSADFSRKPSPSVRELLAFIELHKSHGVTLANKVTFMSGEQPVYLMTVHKAKGLEFDTVVVVDAVEANWRPATNRRKPPANLESLQDYGEDMDDYGRLMFVAATRARRNLLVTSYQKNEQGKETIATPLVASLPRQEASMAMTPEQQLQVVQDTFVWPQLELSDMELLLRPLLANFQLSVTSLINFLDVTRGGPQAFLQRNLLRIPSLKTASSSFGTAMHHALYQAQTLTNRGTFTLDAVLEAFEGALIKEQLATTEADRYLKEGRRLLEHLFNQQWLVLSKGAIPERHIEGVQINGASIRGALDRVEKEAGGGLRVTDYKTGSPLTAALNTSNKALATKAWRHRLQLIFYSLLLNTRAEQPVTGQMVYLQADNQEDFTKTYRPTPEDRDFVGQLVGAVWRKIQSLDFPETTSYSQDYAGIEAFCRDLLAGDT